MTNFYHQKGFTLVELMISIVLGLLITAAAIQLFITGQASLSMQQSMADIQDNGNFGLNYIANDIRRSNLGALSPLSDDQTMYGGIVLAPANLSNFVTIPAALMSRSSGQTLGTGNQWTGKSNVTTTAGTALSSDQLTIQYRPTQNVVPFDTLTKTTLTVAEAKLINETVIGTDCEGVGITLNELREGVFIVQRYFLRTDTTTGADSGLALACAASRYTQSEVEANKKKVDAGTTPAPKPIELKNTSDNPYTARTDIQRPDLGGAGQVIMRRVDHLHYLFGISSGNFDNPTNWRYITLRDYLALTPTTKPDGTANPRPRIRSIQLGMVVRASDSTTRTSLIPDQPTFDIFDQSGSTKGVKVKALAGSPKYLRQAVTQTIALRNSMGIDNR